MLLLQRKRQEHDGSSCKSSFLVTGILHSFGVIRYPGCDLKVTVA